MVTEMAMVTVAVMVTIITMAIIVLMAITVTIMDTVDSLMVMARLMARVHQLRMVILVMDHHTVLQDTGRHLRPYQHHNFCCR
jgi:hypothetical protein